VEKKHSKTKHDFHENPKRKKISVSLVVSFLNQVLASVVSSRNFVVEESAKLVNLLKLIVLIVCQFSLTFFFFWVNFSDDSFEKKSLSVHLPVTVDFISTAGPTQVKIYQQIFT